MAELPLPGKKLLIDVKEPVRCMFLQELPDGRQDFPAQPRILFFSRGVPVFTFTKHHGNVDWLPQPNQAFVLQLPVRPTVARVGICLVLLADKVSGVHATAIFALWPQLRSDSSNYVRIPG